jgi:hypothetical protein
MSAAGQISALPALAASGALSSSPSRPPDHLAVREEVLSECAEYQATHFPDRSARPSRMEAQAPYHH